MRQTEPNLCPGKDLLPKNVTSGPSPECIGLKKKKMVHLLCSIILAKTNAVGPVSQTEIQKQAYECKRSQQCGMTILEVIKSLLIGLRACNTRSNPCLVL